MPDAKALDAIKSKFPDALKDVFVKNERRVYVTIDKRDVPDICRYMYDDLGGRLCIASGVDSRNGIEILYHFMYPKEHQIISLKTIVSKPKPEIESIAVFYLAANWIEREIHEILGVVFINHPNPDRILMADSWPEGVYPLRRDFKEPGK